jgi:hypothetical protein
MLEGFASPGGREPQQGALKLGNTFPYMNDSLQPHDELWLARKL